LSIFNNSKIAIIETKDSMKIKDKALILPFQPKTFYQPGLKS